LEPNLILWDECCGDFAPDGALRDIHIQQTRIAHWNQLLKTLRDKYRAEYFIDGLSCAVPADAEAIFSIRESATTLLRVQVGAATLAYHFFAIDEIEFDVDPREVNSQPSLDQLLEFVKLIGDCVAKQVTMTYENDREHPFISYDPKDAGMSYLR
jgi:hypothetical protein